MRKGLIVILLLLTIPCFAQRSEIVNYINKMEYDSALFKAVALSDSSERVYFQKLIQVLSHGGQQKQDSVIVQDLLPDTKDPYEQLLLGTYNTLNGDRGKALGYLLKSLKQFIAADDELLSVNFLIVLHLYSRIILSDSYKNLIDAFHDQVKDPYSQAWLLLHEIDYRNKIFDPTQDSMEYILLFQQTQRHFDAYDFNSSFKAHFSYRAGIYHRYINQPDSARFYYSACIRNAGTKDFLRYIKFFSYIDLAGLQIQAGRLEEAEENILNAQENWDFSDTILTRLNYNLLMANQYHLRFEDWESAYRLMNEVWGDRLQFFFENNNVRVSELQEEFNVQLKDAQIDSQEDLIASKNQFLWTLSGFLIATLLLTLALVFAFRSIRKKNDKIETLMRELHHRVKNNLQVISSLLGLQSMKLEDEVAKKAVTEGKGRIRAMALIHQKLYQNEEVTILNVREYLSNLIEEIAQAYGHVQGDHIQLNIEEADFDADQALSIGLIVNELVSNAFKYAFSNSEQALLTVNLHKVEQDFILQVSDNGPGLPDGFDLAKAESFGMKLVHLLVRQLKGTFQIINEGGLTCEIRFLNN